MNKDCTLSLPHFIEVVLPSQKSERSCIYEPGISILPLYLRLFGYVLELFRQCGSSWDFSIIDVLLVSIYLYVYIYIYIYYLYLSIYRCKLPV